MGGKLPFSIAHLGDFCVVQVGEVRKLWKGYWRHLVFCSQPSNGHPLTCTGLPWNCKQWRGQGGGMQEPLESITFLAQRYWIRFFGWKLTSMYRLVDKHIAEQYRFDWMYIWSLMWVGIKWKKKKKKGLVKIDGQEMGHNWGVCSKILYKI